MVKKLIVLILASLCSLSFICGCSIGPKEYEFGDFICFERTDYVCLNGLSEQGKEKEVIIVPNTINEKTVEAISYHWGMGTAHGYIESNNLKALYIPSKPIPRCAGEFTFTGSPNLNRIVLLEARSWTEEEYYEFQNRTYELKQYFLYPKDKTYIPNYMSNDTKDKNAIFKYANVSYMYNYEEAENEGFYWADNFAYGTKIEYVPEDPVRDGYEFGGWYKEPECKNAWDFETDTLPEQVLTDDGEEIYQETRLYAKWIKK